MDSQQRAKLQTMDEWVEELSTGKTVDPRGEGKTQFPELVLPELIYDSHRTFLNIRTGKGDGHVALVFINMLTRNEVVAFFNVDLRRQRGKDKGNCYPVGEGGQFLPRPKCNFRKLWLNLFETEPLRWAASHKGLKSRFRGMLLTAPFEQAYSSKGFPYFKIIDAMQIEQIGNKKGTIRRQL